MRILGNENNNLRTEMKSLKRARDMWMIRVENLRDLGNENERLEEKIEELRKRLAMLDAPPRYEVVPSERC
jgi:hypothetical protein